MAKKKEFKKTKEKEGKDFFFVYRLNDKSLDKLRQNNLPPDLLAELEIIKNDEYSAKRKFVRELRKKVFAWSWKKKIYSYFWKRQIGMKLTAQYQAIIWDSMQRVGTRNFQLTEKSFEQLQNTIPGEILTEVRKLATNQYSNKKKFIKDLKKLLITHYLKKNIFSQCWRKVLGKERLKVYKSLIIENAKRKIAVANFEITEQTLSQFEEYLTDYGEKNHRQIVSKLGALKDRIFAHKKDFENALESVLGKREFERFGGKLAEYASINKFTSFILTEENLERIVEVVPSRVTAKLKVLKNKSFMTRRSLINALNNTIGKEKTKDYKTVISNSTKTIYRDYVESIVVALLAAMILRMFVIQAFRIPTGSMKDTLLIGDFLLVNKFIYGVRTPDRIPIINVKIPHVRLPGFKKPKRGDIVVFKYPKNEALDYIKRCVALPGQTVEVRNGDLYVDGKLEGKQEFVKQAYDPEENMEIIYTRITMDNGKQYVIRHYKNGYRINENYGPVKVPEGHYFMMGDNRDNSADSRSWGFLPQENVVGEALIIYWSWDKNIPLYPFYRIFQKVRWGRIAHLIR